MPCPVEEILEGECLSQVKNWETEMLLSPEEYGGVMEHIDSIGCYMDPVLSRNPNMYAHFVLQLLRANIIRFSKTPKSRLGVFFVRKKNGKLRLIVDCRQVNAVFKTPPKGHVVSSAVFGDIEQHINEQMYIAESDIRDFFYRLGIGDEMSDFFALEPVSVEQLRPLLTPDELNKWGHLLTGHEVYPCLRVLPMGFSWSFYIAQEAHRHVTSISLPNTSLLQDNVPVPNLGRDGGLTVIYADNASHIGTDADSVNVRAQKLKVFSRGGGLRCMKRAKQD